MADPRRPRRGFLSGKLFSRTPCAEPPHRRLKLKHKKCAPPRPRCVYMRDRCAYVLVERGGRFYIWITYSPLTPDTSAIGDVRGGRREREYRGRRNINRSTTTTIIESVQLGFKLLVANQSYDPIGFKFRCRGRKSPDLALGWHSFAFRNTFSRVRQRALFSFLFIPPFPARFPSLVHLPKSPMLYPRRSRIYASVSRAFPPT